MIRIMVVLWTVLAAGVGVGLFLLKHEVQALEEELVRLNRAIRLTQENIHVLRAEWSFLNDPTRLHRLAEEHLGMTVLKPEQMVMTVALPAMLDTVVPQSHSQMTVAGRPLPVSVVSGRAKSIVLPRTRRGPTRRSVTRVPHLPLPAKMSPGGTQMRVVVVTEERSR